MGLTQEELEEDFRKNWLVVLNQLVDSAFLASSPLLRPETAAVEKPTTPTNGST